MQKIWSFFLWSTSPSQTRFPARSSAMFIHFPPQADTVNTSSLMIFRVWTDLWNLCRGRRAGPRSLPRDQDITNTFFYCESQQQSGSIHRPSQQTVTGYRLSGGTNMDWLLSIVSSSLLIAPIIPAFIIIHCQTAVCWFSVVKDSGSNTYFSVSWSEHHVRLGSYNDHWAASRFS